jgi:hypothetical protein
MMDMKICKETTACHEATKADIEKIEPDPGMMQYIGEHQEVPKGEAAVMPVGGLRKRRRGRYLAAERHQKTKERTRGYCGSRKRLTVAGRRMIRCAGVAFLRRGAVRKDCTRAKVERATQRIGSLRKILRTHHEGKRRIKDLGDRRPLCLRKERTTMNGNEGWSSGQKSHLGSGGTRKKTLYEMYRGKIAKQVVKTSIGLLRMMDGTLWRGRPPPKRKKRQR